MEVTFVVVWSILVFHIVSCYINSIISWFVIFYLGGENSCHN
jgi:hypothetical protein